MKFMPFTMLVNLVELCGALRNLWCGLSQKPLRRIKAAPSQLGCAAANEDAQANGFPIASGLHFWLRFMCRLRGFGGGGGCHASGVGCLRYNYVKPALAHKNSVKAISSVKAATLQIFRAFIQNLIFCERFL